MTRSDRAKLPRKLSKAKRDEILRKVKDALIDGSVSIDDDVQREEAGRILIDYIISMYGCDRDSIYGGERD